MFGKCVFIAELSPNGESQGLTDEYLAFVEVLASGDAYHVDTACGQTRQIGGELIERINLLADSVVDGSRELTLFIIL